MKEQLISYYYEVIMCRRVALHAVPFYTSGSMRSNRTYERCLVLARCRHGTACVIGVCYDSGVVKRSKGRRLAPHCPPLREALLNNEKMGLKQTTQRGVRLQQNNNENNKEKVLSIFFGSARNDVLTAHLSGTVIGSIRPDVTPLPSQLPTD